MDTFRCFECGLTSCDESEIKRHLNSVHNIKVEVDTLGEKFSCSFCSFGTRNMGEYKKHLIRLHKKEEHNWMVRELKSVFPCDECMLEFTERAMLVNHMDNDHCGDWFKAQQNIDTNRRKENPTKKVEQVEFVSSIVTITPDNNFLTINTADLKLMLEAIPKEALEYDEDAFEKDFKLVLNSGEQQTQQENMESFQCEECNLKAGSRRCLSAHKTFIHNSKYYNCDQCPIKTRTEPALKYHVDIKHNQVLKAKKESCSSIKSQEEDLHIKIETDSVGVQPLYKCMFCNKTFPTEKGTQMHISRMHKECEVCNYRSTSKKDMDDHKRDKHSKRKSKSDTQYKCYICG